MKNVSVYFNIFCSKSIFGKYCSDDNEVFITVKRLTFNILNGF